MKPIKDLGMLYPTTSSKRKIRYGLYECSVCFSLIKSRTDMVNSNTKKGLPVRCVKCRSIKHGLKDHKLYSVWLHQRARCNNINDKRYHDYGGRGIAFSSLFDNFVNWLAYVESLPNSGKDGFTIDRYHNDGNYEPMNLRWVSKATQSQNTRLLRSTNTSGYRGVTKADKRWVAKIWVNNTAIQLGRFDYPCTAAYVYDAYVIENNLEHTRNFTNENYN